MNHAFLQRVSCKGDKAGYFYFVISVLCFQFSLLLIIVCSLGLLCMECVYFKLCCHVLIGGRKAVRPGKMIWLWTKRLFGCWGIMASVTSFEPAVSFRRLVLSVIHGSSSQQSCCPLHWWCLEHYTCSAFTCDGVFPDCFRWMHQHRHEWRRSGGWAPYA